MALHCITGVSGSGKTTIMRELIARGYNALDTDADNLAHWQNMAARKAAASNPEKSRNREWLMSHQWVLEQEKVEALFYDSISMDCLICGVVRPDDSVIKYFEKMFYISLDKHELLHRLDNREEGSIGSSPEQKQQILAWKDEMDAYYLTNALILDGGKRPGILVDAIAQKI